MKTSIFILLFLLLSVSPLSAQLSFCNGSKGDPIFHEDFGPDGTPGEALDPSITSYSYVTGDPSDGEYTISSEIGKGNRNFHSYLPQTTLSNGKAFIVNASYTVGQFYRKQITGLCQNTTYEFSAFLINILKTNSICGTGIPINVKFEIWDETDSILLKEGSTGEISESTAPKWEQFALTFQSKPGQESVILKMFNNAAGGCGNDLAIDDIIFRSCGDLTKVSKEDTGESEMIYCSEETPVQINLKAISDSAVYSAQFYQWQESTDGVNWFDLPGETGSNFSSPLFSSSRYFRVKVAEHALNLLDNLCSSSSEPFYVEILDPPAAPVSLGDVQICSNLPFPSLKAAAGADETIWWYDAPSGGNLLAEETDSFTPSFAGVYYAEARKKGFDCNPSSRTGITFIIYNAPEVEDETIFLCPNATLVLEAGISNMQYLWSTGEIVDTIEITNPGIYSVKIITQEGCSSTKSFEVLAVNSPVIKEVLSEEGNVNILLEKPGEYEFSLDGVNYQNTGYFPSQGPGIYTAFVRDIHECSLTTGEFAHLVLPKFITPNNDGLNDYFELKGVSFFGASEIRIFDRYGKLLASGSGDNFRWDGKMNGKALPSADYWYHISIEGFDIMTGNFSLIR